MGPEKCNEFDEFCNESAGSKIKQVDVYDIEKLVNNIYNDPQRWMDHLNGDLLRFWGDKTATEGKSAFFSTFRANNGDVIPSDSELWPEEYKKAMESSDLKGLVEDAGKYNYIRAHSRQTFAYGIAYNMTGDVKYLNLCRQGAMAIVEAMDENNGLHNKQDIKSGEWMDSAEKRNSQDLAYGITGLGFYYYLTHDETVLQYILDARKYIFDTYLDEGKGYFTWLPKSITTGNDSVEIVSQLDQIYAYMIWLTPSLPEPYQTEWKADLKKIANIMINRFYSEKYGFFWGAATSAKSKQLCTDHTDFGHSVKAMWLIYQIGKITDDISYVTFAGEKIKNILEHAYIKEDGAWARRYNASGVLDKDKEWWGLAELNQAAAILSLNDPSYLHYTNSTYKYWFDHMVDKNDGEIWHMVDAGTDEPVMMFPKIHAWKTSLHSFEHCFLGYMISSYHRETPLCLYYAFSKDEVVSHKSVSPYFFRGNIKEQNIIGESFALHVNDKGRNVVAITFDAFR